MSTLAHEVENPRLQNLELSDELEADLVQVFKLLADRTRLRILMHLLRESELHVSALCELLGQSQPAVSHHLALLRELGLIKLRRDGKHNFYRVRSDRFHDLMHNLFAAMTEGDNTLRFEDFLLIQEK